MKKNLIFSGIKHSGKSLFASLVATLLSLSSFDLDDLILTSVDTPTIREFFIKNGKDKFQAEEIMAYKALASSKPSPFVLSLGGGAADNTPLMDDIKSGDNYIIYLKRREDLVLEKILTKGLPPFLDKNDIEGSFHTLYMRRDRIYSEYADLIIDLGDYSDKEEKRDFIIHSLKENGYEL